MLSFFRLLSAVGLVGGVLFTAAAQQPLFNARQRAALDRIGREIQRERSRSYRRAVETAVRRQIPLRQERADGSVVIVDGVDERGNLLFKATGSATRAGQTTRTSALYAGGSLGLSLSGADTTVRDRLGVWDGGRIRQSHVELTGRVTLIDDSPGIQNHPTHVAGILIGAGLNERARGMAFGARLKAYDFSNDETEVASAAPGLLISNHSYNYQAGWILNSNRSGDVKWEWHGDTTLSATDDYKFGLYNSGARNWDRIAYNAPYYLLVRSAGNSHGQNGPGAGAPYWLINGDVISRTARRDQSAYDLISTDANAKNILTVGAVGAISTEYFRPADARLATFSSWGPSDDGRIKPDLVGVGVNVLSSGSAGDNAYTSLSGTSMATPNVAGSLLLLQEHYARLNAGRLMRSSTLKGVALHTADEAGDAPGPDYRFGWGLLNAERAARVIGNTDQSHLLEERTLNQGETQTVRLTASGRGPLIVTICWTDPEGTALPAAVSSVNNRTPRLVNDLDIRVTDGTRSLLPWVLDPENPARPATPGDNLRDNTEQVLIADAVPGKSYTLTVSHKNALRSGKQEFALIISGIGGKEYCVSGASSPERTRIDRVRFGTIDRAGGEGCRTYSDITAVSTTVSAGQRVPLEVLIGSCGENRQTVTKAFVDWNLDGDFDDPDELAATSAALTSPATFTATVTVPTGLIDGQTTRLRIVTVETTEAGAVSACGTYPNGETQDYLVQFVRPRDDVGISALVSPENGFCGQSEIQIVARVRNYGSAAQRNIPVTVQVMAPFGRVVASLRDTLRQTLEPAAEAQILLRGPGTTQAATAYRFSIQALLPGDQNTANNQLESILTAAADPGGQGRFTAMSCDTAVSLRNTGTGTAFWYDAPTGGKLLGAGNQTVALSRPSGGVYYASLNDFSGRLGPAGKQAFGGGSYSGNFGPEPLISTQVPLVLERARLYIGTAGRLTFTVKKPDGTPVSSVTLDVTPTRNPATPPGNLPSGQQSDDPNDIGAEYWLNLRIPEPGNYRIGIEYEDGATIFRSNVGVTGFPFRIPDVARLDGALFNGDTITNSYYYLYDLQVKSLACAVPARVPVTVQPGTAVRASVTAEGPTTICTGSAVTLRAAEGPGYTYQWFRNGQPVPGATLTTLTASTAGSYTVRVAGECVPVMSAPVAISVRPPEVPTITRDGNTLTSSASADNQWLYNGLPITGATQRTYVARQSGRYAVRANVNGCGELVSREIELEVITSVGSPSVSAARFVLAPNPVSRQVRIEYAPGSAGSRNYSVQLLDGRGVVVRSAQLVRAGDSFSVGLDVSSVPAGTYVVLIRDAEGRSVGQGKMLKY
ncbi:S8 family serine peptidase [Larkinella soli]|uniref:S8 family serine peptidase n=1 Tax=Larkinella soli TaxID=1770527 RepID=UPI000FFB8D9A|nr:S8 family serine peptidase [Larkinella soli]